MPPAFIGGSWGLTELGITGKAWGGINGRAGFAIGDGTFMGIIAGAGNGATPIPCWGSMNGNGAAGAAASSSASRGPAAIAARDGMEFTGLPPVTVTFSAATGNGTPADCRLRSPGIKTLRCRGCAVTAGLNSVGSRTARPSDAAAACGQITKISSGKGASLKVGADINFSLVQASVLCATSTASGTRWRIEFTISSIKPLR